MVGMKERRKISDKDTLDIVLMRSAGATLATIPDHGSKDLAIGTVRAAIKNLQIDWEDFKGV